MVDALPKGLSSAFWSIWYPCRQGASVVESLSDGEEWIGQWDSVGLYEGNNKILSHQTLSVHLTTYRLILVPDQPTGSSLSTQLEHVRQTEFYVGFMRSSPKITLVLGLSASTSADSSESVGGGGAREAGGWTCSVCGFGNETTYGSKCGLCGVPKSQSQSQSQSRSHSRSTSVSHTPTTTDAQDPDGRIACPACTFLNHRYLPKCEICSTPLPSSGPVAKRAEVVDEVIRLSFRRGGEKEAYKKLKSVLGEKAWERVRSWDIARDEVERSSTPRLGGIDGILQSINLESKSKDETMQDAFKDLEVLMVKLAQSLSSKISYSTSADDTTLIQTSLVQLGLPSPALTQDMVRSANDGKYFDGLARELSGILVGKHGIMLQRGVISLDEVWGLWMRARGVALLPPSTLMSILPYLPRHTSPQINSLTLPSSLQVLYTPTYSPLGILSKLLAILDPELDSTNPNLATEKNLNIIEIASHVNLPIGLSKDLIEVIEADGGLLRDDQSLDGRRWYRDLLTPTEIPTT
ncbi:ESCRT-II complex subunit VPS36, partial [Tremellales sp. Uapishka_1]